MGEFQEIVLPGLVDMHVHLREPGDERKEDFETGTQAAIAGGVTTVFDMPNNKRPIRSLERLGEKMLLANQRVYADIGFYYGYQPEEDNIGSFERARLATRGLKSYPEVTTSSDAQTSPADFREGWQAWHEVASQYQPIILHAEKDTIEEALAISAGEIGHPTHVLVSDRPTLEVVMSAKKKDWPVTCGVTPHHLFMNQTDVRDWFQRMKPPLASPEHQEFLWRHFDQIDVIETDHTPHTKLEKQHTNHVNPTGSERGVVKCYGVPGLESMLPLLLHAVKLGKLTTNQLIDKTSTRPNEILGLTKDPTTSVKVRMEDYEFSEDDVRSKCGWTPYAGRLVTGRVIQVDLHGETVYREGEFIGSPQGRILPAA